MKSDDEVMPAAVAVAVKTKLPKAGADRLDAIRNKLREARALQLEIDDTQEKLSELQHKLYEIQGGGKERGELVDLMESVSMRNFTLEAEGNWPAYSVTLQPYYNVSFPTDADKRADAINYIAKDMGVPDLVKNVCTVSFGKGESKLAKQLIALLKKAKMYDRTAVASTVHAQTLKAEIRRRFESGKPLSPTALETIGATVGKVVKMKPVD